MKTGLLIFALSALATSVAAAQTPTDAPETVAMRQIDAWNAHDAAAFAAT